jgi:uncharacterized UPF0160 family protein
MGILMRNDYTPRSCGTHNGPFHADEVSACAMLIIFDLIDRDKILRSRDPEALFRCEYVCDVGGSYDPEDKLFDHHQVEYVGDKSSAGMILSYLREINKISDQEFYLLRGKVIAGVDAEDNGKEPGFKGLCTFSAIIGEYNPIDRETPPESYDEAFDQALNFALRHLRRILKRREYIASFRIIVKKAMEANESFLFIDRNIPWMESFFSLGGQKHPARFVIMPSGQHWKLRGIPPSLSRKMEVQISLPKEWAGLLEEELKEVSGIPGAIFCHKGLFISVWETKEDALKALEYTMNTTQAASKVKEAK